VSGVPLVIASFFRCHCDFLNHFNFAVVDVSPYGSCILSLDRKSVV
jgi:hypothetical protein